MTLLPRFCEESGCGFEVVLLELLLLLLELLEPELELLELPELLPDRELPELDPELSSLAFFLDSFFVDDLSILDPS